MSISHLRLIEIELFSYCNRKCLWCPNMNIDRKSAVQFLDRNIFTSLIQELQKHSYNHAISFSRYNEPMSHISEFKAAIAYIKQQLPGATLVTNTNGDFLTAENLDGLYIDQLTVMDYDSKGIDNCVSRLRDCGCAILNVNYPYILAKRNNMDILYYVDWPQQNKIGNRGGALPQFNTKHERVAPCYEPKYFIGINYDGTVSPCCNIRNDITQHQNYIFGDLYNSPLSEIIQTEPYTQFVKDCANGIFDINSPCTYCSNGGGRYTREESGINYE